MSTRESTTESGPALAGLPLVAALPFLGSMLAFVFVAGQLSYYDLPLLLIELDFVTLAIFTSFGVLALLALFGFFLIVHHLNKSGNPVVKAFAQTLLSSVVIFLFVVAAPFDARVWAYFAGFVGLQFVVLLLIALPRKAGESYSQRLTKAADEMLPANRQYGDTERLLQILSLTAFLLFLVFMMGGSYARSKTQYLTFREGETLYAVVYRYGDQLVGKALSADRRRLLDRVIIVSSSTDASVLDLPELKVTNVSN